MAALISIDAFGWIDALRRTTKLFQYLVLITSMTFTGVVSFLGSCGGALAAHRPTGEAVGLGMMTAATMIAMVWRRLAPKGSVAVLPMEEAKAELNANAQVISK